MEILTPSIIKLHCPENELYGKINLPSSKSESNRALIINALAGGKNTLNKLSEAKDTKILQALLTSDEVSLDAENAGTALRFITAYKTILAQQAVITGSERMKSRPLEGLVTALRHLGADIDYLENEGFPPIRINEFIYSGKKNITMDGSVSSQFSSAILLIAPLLPDGLEVTIKRPIASEPYIKMTLSLMEHFGIHYEWDDNIIRIAAQSYKENSYTIESDWSAAGYWYSMLAIASEGEVFLEGLRKDSYQGDSILVGLFEKLGVTTRFEQNGIWIKKSKEALVEELHYDFGCYPDLAMTIIVTCAALNVRLVAKGLHNLRVKESDRLEAIQNELSKFMVGLKERNEGGWELTGRFRCRENEVFATYDDHRLAMSLAPLAILTPIQIEYPEVVEKSYPNFWRDLKKAGIEISN